MQDHLRLRRELIETAPPGIEAARRLASLTDEAVSELAEAASSRLGRRWAVVALGGYGAGRLLPGSDLDLLLLAEDTGGAVREAAKELLYPLWDAGLTVGHQVRTRKQHMRACRGDMQTLTASLTGRVIAGDADYGEDALRAVAADARKRGSRMLAEIAARDRPGSPYLLQPDLKEGAGGQRDVDEMTWTCAVLAGEPCGGPGRLADLGVMDAQVTDAVLAAADTLAAARWELQAGGGTSHMTLAAAETLSAGAQDVQDALAVVNDALTRLRAAIAPPARADAVRRIADAGALIDAARAGDAERIERAAFRGELDDLVPGLREILTLRRPGLSHALTVGAHCIATACGLAAISAADPALAHSAEDAGDTRTLVVAALAHDAGKRTPGPGHAERGEEAVTRTALACGLGAKETEFAARLVRHHLLLPDSALHTDPADPDAIAALAAAVGDVRTLGALHLLSAADSAATGPGAWTAWHAALLATLVATVRAHLARAPLRDASAILSEALSLLGEPAGRGAAWLAAAPPRYLAGRTPREAASDADLASALLDAGRGAPPALHVSPAAAEGAWTVGVAAHDRPGLFATLAGVLALAGLDVLTASANGWDGLAIDSFTVRSATLAPVSHDVWAKVERFLTAATRGHLALESRLEERRAHYATAAGPQVGVEPSVRFDTSEPDHALLHVVAPDRVGLLHDIAWALSSAGLDIAWANAVVQDGLVRDAFRVSSADGSHREPGALGHAAMRIRERLAAR